MRQYVIAAVLGAVLTTSGVVSIGSAEPAQDGCVPTGPQVTNTVGTRYLTGRDSDKLPVLALHGLRMCAGRAHLLVGGYVATVSENMLQATDMRDEDATSIAPARQQA